MTRRLRILFVDDREADTLLLTRPIGNARYVLETDRVDGAEQLRSAMERSWDVVISDYAMHEFDGPEALAVVRELQPDLPFIVVSNGSRYLVRLEQSIASSVAASADGRAGHAKPGMGERPKARRGRD